jgi:4-carboxymuconolactone decarboxylase
MTDARTDGLAVFKDLLPGLIPDDVTSMRDDGFAGELGELDRRSRSLVTLGALIALRAGEELKFHFPIALRNGLTAEELEEVVYHLTGYVGFPAATLARNVGREVLPKPDRQSGSWKKDAPTARYDIRPFTASSVVVPFKQVSGPVRAGLNLSASTSSAIALSPCPPTTASEKQVSRWLCSMTRFVRSNADCTAEICFITSTQ